MDVDAPSKVQFTSDNASGKKRTAADLPISALDNLPWYASHLISKQVEADDLDRVEKYRPNSLDDVSGHQDILATINRFIEAMYFLAATPRNPNPNDLQRLPHLLLYGPPGTGKTSTVLALARRIYGEKTCDRWCWS